MLLQVSGGRADRAVNDVATRMNMNVLSLGEPDVWGTGDPSIMLLHREMQQWIGFRGLPARGQIGFDIGVIERRKKQLGVSSALKQTTKGVSTHARLAIEQKMLSTCEPPAYSMSNISYHRPLLLTSAKEKLPQGSFKYALEWELGAYQGGSTTMRPASQNLSDGDGSSELR